MAIINDRLQFAIVAPQGVSAPRSSMNVSTQKNEYVHLIEEMQRLRGRVALREGAIKAAMLDSSGRHVLPDDCKSWHLLRLRPDGKLVGCARILVHPWNVKYNRLRVAASAVAQCPTWARRVRDAVECEIERARLRGQTLVEPGGWVVDEEVRGTCEAVALAIGAFAWAQILGDCVGFLTATEKHGSSTILRRLGGRNLVAGGQTIPGYFEPAWGCNAELLRFDTYSLNNRFEAALSTARVRLLHSPIFCLAPQPAVETTQVSLSAGFHDTYQPAFAVRG